MKKRITLCGLAALFSFLCTTTSLGADYLQKADEYLQKELQLNRFMGSVMVARSNQIVFIKGYGLANLEHNIPNGPDTKFRLGSITKQFTAVCILKLQEEGKLSVDDPISKFITDCPTNWSGIKIRHLLTHTSGIPSFTGFPDYVETMMLRSLPEKTIGRFRDKPLEFKPGERFVYSNSGYILLGYLVEKASGKAYEDYLQKAIFKPLGMKDSGYDHFEQVLPHRATGYSRDADHWVNSAYIDMTVPYGAGALYSTVEDFYRWYQCWRDRKILSEASWKMMTTPEKGNYGFGIGITEHFKKTDQKAYEHGGGINGFATSMKWFPEADLFIAAFANSDSARADVVANNLAALMFDLPVELPKERKPIKLDPKQLEPLVGRYELSTNFVLTITATGEQLFVQATGQSKTEVFPESETNFFSKIVDAQMTFYKDSSGKVTHLVLHQNGDRPAKRLKD
jgi:CubicO group peptidase (beta-lactamase class C family)